MCWPELSQSGSFFFNFSLLLSPQWRIRNQATYPSLRWSSSRGLLLLQKGHSGQSTSYDRSTALTLTKYGLPSLILFNQLATGNFRSNSHASSNFLKLLPTLTLTCVFLFKDCPEFDLVFDNAFDQWVAGSAGEKCTFIQILHHTCQRYSPTRKPEFINCQSKLLGGKI